MNVAEQAARLEAAKRKTTHAPTVLRLWIDGSDTSEGIPGIETVTTSTPEHCRDCGSERTLFCWQHWPMVCGWCSLARFENGGENPKTAERAEATKRRVEA